MGRSDVINIPDMSKELTQKIVQAVNIGIQKAEKAVQGSTVKINGMNIQVDTATQGVIDGLNKQIEEINKKKDKIQNAIEEIYSYKPNGNKKYAISQSGNSYALTDQQIQTIEKMVIASKNAGNKITASEKQQLEMQYRLINAKDELINRIKAFKSADEKSYNSSDVKQYYKDVSMLEKVMKNLQSLSQETKLQVGFDTKGIDVKSLMKEIQNRDWLSGKLTQGLENEIAALQNNMSKVMQNAQKDLVSNIMGNNPLSKVQKEINAAEQAISTSYSNIEQRTNQLVKEINDSLAIVNDVNSSQSAYDNAEKQLEKSITTLAKYKDLLKNNASVNNILNNEDLQIYIDEGKLKGIKDVVIENNSAIIRSNQETIASSQEYIKSLEWAKGSLGIAHGEDIINTFKETISSLTAENEKLKTSLETTSQVANEEFNQLQQKFEASSKLVKELESFVADLEAKIKEQTDSLARLEGEKRKLEEKAVTGSKGTGASGGVGGAGEKTDPFGDKNYLEHLNQIKQATNEISNNLKTSLIEAVTKFKEELQSTSNLSYTKMFESLRNSLRDIVNEFQTSLTNIRFGSSNSLYDTLKGWSDASRYMSNYNEKSDAERAAFANLETGSISNSYVFDKKNAFNNKLLEILNKASHGIEQDISKVYDTWIHSHPVESSKRVEISKNKWENITQTGSDVGFSVADLNTWVKQCLESGIKNMLVTNNYKYTKLDLTDVSKEKFEEFKKEFVKNLKNSGVKADGITGETSVPVSIKGAGNQRYIDLDEKTNIINSAMIKASETVFGSNRLTTGNITDLIKDFSVLSDKENEAVSNMQKLYTILNNLNGVLNSSDNMLQFGASENSLNGFINQIKEIANLINNNGLQVKQEGQGSKIKPISIPVEANIESLNTSLQSKKDQILPVDVKVNAVPNATVNTATNVGTTGMAYETEQAENLRKKIVEVTTAVDNKTNAFRQEEQVVAGTVQSEITSLEILDGQLTIILQDIQKIIEKPLKINIDYSSIDQLSQVDENGKSSIDKLKASIDGLETEILHDLGRAFSGLQLPNGVSGKIENLAKALEMLKTSLSNIDSGSIGFLDSVKDLAKKADGLKDIVAVIRASEEEIQKAQTTIAQQKKPVDVQGYSANDVAIGTEEWDKAIKRAEKLKNVIGEIQKVTYNFRRGKDGKYYKSFSFFGEKGKAVEGKDGKLLYGNEIKNLDEVASKTSQQMDNLITKFEDAAKKAKLVYDVGSLRIDDNGIITFSTTVEELGDKAITTRHKIEDLNEALNKDGSLSKKYLNNHAENKSVKDLSKVRESSEASFKKKDQTEMYNSLSKAVQQYIHWLKEENKATGSAKDAASALRSEAENLINSLRSDIKSYGLQNLEKELELDRQILEARREINYQDEAATTKMAKSSYDRELKLEEKKAQLQKASIGANAKTVAKNDVRIAAIDELIKKEQQYRVDMGLEGKAQEASAQLINKRTTLTRELKTEQQAYNAAVTAGNNEASSKLEGKAAGLKARLADAMSVYKGVDTSEAQSLLNKLNDPLANWSVDSNTVNSVVKNIERETNKIINALKTQHKKIEEEKKKTLYAGRTKDYTNLLNESFAGTTFEGATFKSATVTSSGSGTLKFLEIIGDKAREVTVTFKDVLDVINQLQNGTFDFANYQSTPKTRAATKADIFGGDKTAEENNHVQKTINAYNELIKTEETYQRLKAKVDTGTATQNQIAEFNRLSTLRKEYNDIISSSIVLTKQEQQFYEQSGKAQIDALLVKYKEKQEQAKHTYNAHANVLSEEEQARVEAALKNTSQLMDQLFNRKQNIPGFKDAFDRAQAEVDKLNNKLSQGKISNIQTGYTDKINKMVAELNNIIGVTNPLGADPNAMRDAENMMRQYAQTINNGKVQIGDFNAQNGTMIVGFEKQKGVIQEIVLSWNSVTGAISAMPGKIKRTQSVLSSFMDGLKARFKSLVQYLSIFVSYYRIVGMIKNGIQVVRDLDTALTEMRKVSDESVESLRKFQDVSFDIAKSVGTTAKQIQNSTADFMRLGESLEQAAKSAEVANILLNVSEFEGIDEATESLVAMSAAYDDLGKIDIVDKLNEVGNNFAISTDGLATALQSSASALKTAKNDIDESIALATAANAVVQDPDKVGAGKLMPEHIVICGYLYTKK